MASRQPRVASAFSKAEEYNWTCSPAFMEAAHAVTELSVRLDRGRAIMVSSCPSSDLKTWTYFACVCAALVFAVRACLLASRKFTFR